MSDNPFAEPDDNDRTVIRTITRKPDPRKASPDATTADATVVAEPARRAPRPERSLLDVNFGLAAHVESPLASAAAPLLQLLARLRNTLTPPDAGDLRERAAAAMRVFEQTAKAAGVQRDLLQPAHYALCASLDDAVLNTPWGSQGDWMSQSLVSGFHNEVRSGERFFDLLSKMLENPTRFLPVLELMYMCLSLGFMGRYRLSPRGPAEVDRLREDVYAAISSLRPRGEADLSPGWRGVDAPYRQPGRRLPLWVAGSAGLALIGGLFVWFSLDLNAASDAVYDRALHTPPTTMPAVVRTTPAQPPKAAPATAEAGALDRLKAFLHAEIDAGQVEVLGTETMPIVRVRQLGLFNSGSATVIQKSVPVLERVGTALKAEQGPVQVVGYTDDQPIRTVRFPSNFQLSTARAEAASAVIATSIGDRSRLSTEGRADAEPIASNTTPEGRDANRRIEIILHRQG
jgi:type VI secretion system protein ImpK